MKTRLFAFFYRLRPLFLTLLVGGGLAIPASGQMSPGPSQSADNARPQSPDFTLKQMNGETFRLSDHRGEIVVLNFWATWCPPCRKEIPGFITLQKEFEERGVTFVGVSLDKDGFTSVRPYAEKMEINYPLVVDDGRVAQKYGGVRVLPATFLIGPEGKVHYERPGFFPEGRLRTQLQALLKKTASDGS